MIAKVIVDILHSNVDRVFDYLIPQDINVLIGHRVKVPFGNRTIEGYVIDIKETTSVPNDKIKSIIAVLDDLPAITAEMIQLMYFMQGKYHILLAEALRKFLPTELRGGRVSEKVENVIVLNDEVDIESVKSSLKSNAVKQKQLLDFMSENKRAYQKHLNEMFTNSAVKKFLESGLFNIVQESVNRTPYNSIDTEKLPSVTLTYKQNAAIDIIKKNSPATFLLFGVTGSGKTEIYLNCIDNAIKQGKGAIMMVPEIALTPQILKIFRSRFSDNVAILHSGLSAGERLDEWNRLRRGEARIAVGARSAIFAPIENVGIIILDEQHEQSYVSESSPRFDTHDIAEFRGKHNGCSVVLGSATPLVESFYKAEKGQFKLIELTERINGRAMPEITMVDMRQQIRAGNNSIFSSLLKEKLESTLESGNQAMLFINRRGYSPIVVCSDCGYTAKCTSCDVTLNYHKAEDLLKCHYCGNKYNMLAQCPSCAGKNIRKSGAGTQKVCDELKTLFPKTKILRMDNDTTSTKESHHKIIQKFSNKEADILVGTQMIAKGHNFPLVTLVGVLDADLSLYFSDYRSVERTFSLITQVAGRAGRAEMVGEVLVQTHTPHHYVYKMITEYNYRGFYKREISLREAAKYPPFARVLRIMVIAEDEKAAQDNIKNIYEKVKMIRENKKDCFIYLNAMKSPVYRIKDRYRYQILARIYNEIELITDNMYDIVDLCKVNNVVSYLEINPSSMF